MAKIVEPEEPENEIPSEAKPSKLAVLKTLSVEPAGFLLIVSMIITHLIMANLSMETICRVDLNYPEEMCKEIISNLNATYKPQELEIQKISADISAKTSVVLNGASIFFVLFLGPWSDTHGRKLPLLLSISGMIMFNLVAIVGALIIGKISGLTLGMLVIIPLTVTGAGVVFAMAAYSYISDTTSIKSRTIRTGILSASIRSGSPIGFAIGGALTKFGAGRIASLLVSAGIVVIAFLIILFQVKSVKPKLKDETEEKEKKSAFSKYNPVIKLINTFKILLVKRKNQAVLWLLIICHICYAAPGQGEYYILYLFVRERLQWTITEYGFFSMCNWIMQAVGVVISMFILSKTFKLSDPLVGFLAGISQIGGSITYSLVSTGLVMYLASVFDMMNGTIGVVVRSMMSKMVSPDETGKLFALLGVMESLLPLAMVPTYSMLYKSTVGQFSGAFFLLSAAVTIPAEIIFLYFMFSNRGPQTFQTNPVVMTELKEKDEFAVNINVVEPEAQKFISENENSINTQEDERRAFKTNGVDAG